jgi:hypothetical protein
MASKNKKAQGRFAASRPLVFITGQPGHRPDQPRSARIFVVIAEKNYSQSHQNIRKKKNTENNIKNTENLRAYLGNCQQNTAGDVRREPKALLQHPLDERDDPAQVVVLLEALKKKIDKHGLRGQGPQIASLEFGIHELVKAGRDFLFFCF